MKEQTNTSELFFEQLSFRILQFFHSYRISWISTMVFGMLAHGFAFVNKFINFDEIYNLFGKGATLDSGRWGLGFLDSIFPNYSMPWIYGILTIFLIAVAVCLISHVFAIHHPVLQALLAGTIVVFPVWTSTFSFMFTSSSYGVAFLMAVFSVFLLRVPHPFSWILALGCGIFSVAIYQAYIAIIASLLVLLLIQDLLSGEDLLLSLRKGFCYVGFLILALGLYYIATQAVLILRNVTFNQYADERNSFSISTLPRNIGLAYSSFFQALTTGEYALIPTLASRRFHCFGLVSCVVLLLVLFRSQRMPLSRILFVLALIVVFPLAASCMYLFTVPAAIHTLILCGYMSIYVLMILLANLCLATLPKVKCLDLFRRLALNILILVLFVIIISNTYFANEAYLQLHLQYENTYAFYTSLLSDIRMHPEFDEDTQLAVIGNWSYPDYFFKKFDFTYHLFGHLGASPSEYSVDRFLTYYIGFQIPFASVEETLHIQDSAEYQQMPEYPYYGSIRMFGDTLVVKLS